MILRKTSHQKLNAGSQVVGSKHRVCESNRYGNGKDDVGIATTLVLITMMKLQIPMTRLVILFVAGSVIGRTLAFQNLILPRGAIPIVNDSTGRNLANQEQAQRAWDRRCFVLRLAEEDEANDASRIGSALRKIRKVLGFPLRRLKRLFQSVGEDESENSGTEVSTEPVLDEATESETLAASSIEATDIPISDQTTTATAIAQETATASDDAAVDEITLTKSEEVGDRWCFSAPSVDLSGEWGIIVSDSFKEEYDKYLTLLGQPLLVRAVALSIVGLTTEETEQKEKGKELFIRGRNVRGTWERTLIASGAAGGSEDYTPELTPLVTADGEDVEAEAWWENRGTVHCSWLRGVKRYGGGDFESKRYLESDGKVLVCESTFHPTDTEREKARVTWRFLRHGETL